MNKPEMKGIITEMIKSYRTKTYKELKGILESSIIVTEDISGKSGEKYQTEIQVFWDDKPNENIRVLITIDESPHKPLLGFIPIYLSGPSEDFIKSPNNEFIDE